MFPHPYMNYIIITYEYEHKIVSCSDSFSHKEKDLCSPNPCHNRGHCLARGESDFECNCGSEFTGLKCESECMVFPFRCSLSFKHAKKASLDI